MCLAVPFSLTLPLSLEEGEQPLSTSKISDDCRAEYRHKFILRRGTIPPLPAGEGRSEGMASRNSFETKRISTASQISVVALSIIISPFSKCPRPRKFPPATAIHISIPLAKVVLIFPAVARCCRWRGFPLRDRFASRSTRRLNQVSGSWGKRGADFPETVACGVGFHRQQIAALLDDGEFVNQTLEFRDQMRGDKYRAAAGIAGLIRANDGLDEFAADNRVEAARRLVQHEQFRFGTDRADECELRALAF